MREKFILHIALSLLAWLSDLKSESQASVQTYRTNNL